MYRRDDGQHYCEFRATQQQYNPYRITDYEVLCI